MHHWLTGRKKKSVFLCFPSLSVQWPILWYCHFFFKVNQASPQISTSKGGAQVCSWFFPPCEAWGNGVVIDSCASAPVVWKSWGKPVFCRAQSLVAGLEVVLKPPHRLSHPFVRSRWSPWGIPQEAGWWMRRRKHLSPRIPQGKTLRGFKTRNTTIRDGHVHSTKVYPLLLQETVLKCLWRSISNSSFHFQEFEKFPCLASSTASCKILSFPGDCRRVFLY